MSRRFAVALALAHAGCGSSAPGGSGAQSFRIGATLDERLDAGDVAAVEVLASREGGFGVLDAVTLDHGRTVETRDADGDGTRGMVLTWAEVGGERATVVTFGNPREEPTHLAGDQRRP